MGIKTQHSHCLTILYFTQGVLNPIISISPMLIQLNFYDCHMSMVLFSSLHFADEKIEVWTGEKKSCVNFVRNDRARITHRYYGSILKFFSVVFYGFSLKVLNKLMVFHLPFYLFFFSNTQTSKLPPINHLSFWGTMMSAVSNIFPYL